MSTEPGIQKTLDSSRWIVHAFGANLGSKSAAVLGSNCGSFLVLQFGACWGKRGLLGIKIRQATVATLELDVGSTLGLPWSISFNV